MSDIFFCYFHFLYMLAATAGTPLKWNQVYQTYINQYKDMAIEGMLKYGVPASITLAQGLLESNAGRGRLVLLGNNHFGIKCHGWTGRTITHDDDEHGRRCFSCIMVMLWKALKIIVDSFETDLVIKVFLANRSDYRGWAYGLKRAGYATNPVMHKALSIIIETYQLYQYDKAKDYDRFMVHHSGE